MCVTVPDVTLHAVPHVLGKVGMKHSATAIARVMAQQLQRCETRVHGHSLDVSEV